MTLRAFIRANRAEIDRRIFDAGGIFLDPAKLRRNDDERRRWLVNDEGLYLWAKSEGVDV